MRRIFFLTLPILFLSFMGCSDQGTAPDPDFAVSQKKPDKPPKPPPDPDPGVDASPVIAYEFGPPGARTLWVIDEDGENRTEIFVPGNFFVPSWSPLGDGTEAVPYEILITGTLTGILPVMKVEVFLDGGVPKAGAITTLSTDPMYIQARVSPDGQEFVAVHVGPPEDFQGSLVVSGMGAFSPVNVYENPGHEISWPTWRPDGNIAFLEHLEAGQASVQVLDRETGSVFEVFQVPPELGTPRRLSWSPDGNGFAFDAGGDLYRVVLGNDLEILGSGISPSWSPDGSKVAYSNRDRLYVKTVESSSKDDRMVSGRMPDWRRDPS